MIIKNSRKYTTLILFLLILFLSLNSVYADQLVTENSGVVSGGVYFNSSNPGSAGTHELDFVLPEDLNTSNIRWAGLYINIYDATTTGSYGVSSSVTVNGKLIDRQNLTQVTQMNSGTTYRFNENITKTYLDYRLRYNVTGDIVAGNNKVIVSSEEWPGYLFDGRIKYVALIVAYDDGDDDQIHYWINGGQDWLASGETSSTVFNTSIIPSNASISSVYLDNIVGSSSDGSYKLNGNSLTGGVHTSGWLYQRHNWNVYNYFNLGENTVLDYTTGIGSSFRTELGLLTVCEGELVNGIDLSVDSISTVTGNIYRGIYNRLNVLISNKGEISSGNNSILLELYDGNKLISFGNLDEIKAKGSALVAFDIPFLDNDHRSNVNYTLRISSRDYDDINLNNNNLTVNFNVLNQSLVDLVVNNSVVDYGNSVLIKALLTEKGTGKIISGSKIGIYVNGVLVKSLTTDWTGTVSYKYKPTSIGILSIGAVNYGLDNYKVTASVSNLTVRSPVKMSVSPGVINTRKTVVIKVTLRNAKNELLKNHRIYLVINNKVYSAVSDKKSGVAKFTVTGLSRTSYSFTVHYLENSVFKASKFNSKVYKRPDLYIYKIRRSGNSYKVTVRNKGSAVSGTTYLKLYYKKGKRTYAKVVRVAGIKVGKTRIVTVRFYKYSSHRRYYKWAYVNYKKNIVESSFSNNLRRFR